jgi:hypothetical protein
MNFVALPCWFLKRAFAMALVLILACPGIFPMDTNSVIAIGDSRINVVLDGGDWGIAKAGIPAWILSAGQSVAAYYGRYPLPEVKLEIAPFQGEGVRHGMTFGEHGGYIMIHVGNNTTQADFTSDWMLTHEMVHLSFPSVEDNHHWIEEGIATYVEPIARVQAGHLDKKEMWFEMVRDMPQGLPGPGDQGLDRTHSWANTYWGGARFCLLADVEIRRATGNQKGLQDALRGILDAGGDIRQSWPLEKALETGDKATGTHVLVSLYEKMKDKPVQTDLPGLWRELGVTRNGNTVTFDDNAPLAAVRKAITAGSAAGSPR